ncbi:hypothetical protein [Chitinophaga alhagiae]|uniref:hypothetical protein n=1 Tax=Chitinophaga alhagiae TaxID=2203219 RepID=UPI000E5BF785|nr:hypothetical protein [Chitinophaga alhagiae]
MENSSLHAVQNSGFTDKIDVVCPRCERKALVIGAGLHEPVTRQEEKVRFSCAQCRYAIRYANTPKLKVYVNSRGKPKYSRTLHLNTSIDPFFGFTLWYRIQTNEGLLWAYNLEHLAVIEACIADDLHGRNRAYLLRLIDRLRKREDMV